MRVFQSKEEDRKQAEYVFFTKSVITQQRHRFEPSEVRQEREFYK